MKRQGFTLVEVVVALGIASGALVLLISANQQAMRRSMRAHERVRLEEQLEMKAAEIRSGLETESNGAFAALPGWSWQAAREPAHVEGVSSLDEITIRVLAPGNDRPVRTVAFFQFAPGAIKR
jgi:prepilin-type N-terminal cleavage/methylation domain-containing protein